MWLDMYLERRKNSSSDKKEIIYWRKANQIFKWFEWNVDTNENDLRDCKIWIDKLKNLLVLINSVLEKSILVDWKIKNWQSYSPWEWWKDIMVDWKYISNPSFASSLLPTTSWFFFWSGEYDEYYIQQLEETKDELIILISEHKPEYEYYYSASR